MKVINELEKLGDKISEVANDNYKRLNKEQKELFDSIINDIWSIIEIESEKEGDEDESNSI